MTEALLGVLAEGGGFALRWLWQATLIAAAALVFTAWLGRRRPLLAQGLLLAAFVRFAFPPVTLVSWVEGLPPLLSGPREQGLELLVASEAGLHALSWPAWLLALYSIGVLLGTASLAKQILGLSLRLAKSRRLEAPWLARIEFMSRRLGLRRVPEVRVSDRATVPFVASPLRPIVVLPRSVVEELQPQELERVVAHELAHLRRGDLWWNALLATLGIVWFFHPLFYLASSKWRRLAEEQCDALVVNALEVPPKGYAKALVATAAVCVSANASNLALAVLPRRRHHLERRLELLGKAGPIQAASPIELLSSTVIALAVVAALGVGAAPVDAGARRLVFAHDRVGAELAQSQASDASRLGAPHENRHNH